ncbi:hypothetical protein P7C71_g2032, partial [Lecanoromycetidae sp. Uapishka_2]
MWAGAGGLDNYGPSVMLRAWAVFMVCVSGPLLFFIKPRVPVSRTSPQRALRFTFLKTPTFWIYELGNVIESFGFFIPGIYLPSYARKIGLSTISGTVAVALFNLMSVLGAVILGHITDQIHATNAILISAIGTSVAVFGIWGFATSHVALWLFSVFYGLFAGGYSCTWTGSIREIKKQYEDANACMLFGLLAAGRGIGSVATGPLTEALLLRMLWAGEEERYFGYGTGYGPLIILTGVSAVLSGVSWAARKFGWL